MINFPAGKMRPLHFPVFALPIRCQDERALTCSSQYSYSAHLLKLLTANYADQGGFLPNQKSDSERQVLRESAVIDRRYRRIQCPNSVDAESSLARMVWL